jgi:hypothetical protein
VLRAAAQRDIGGLDDPSCIEFWVENRLMVELVSPEMAREYENFLKTAQLSAMNDPENLRAMRSSHLERQVT